MKENIKKIIFLIILVVVILVSISVTWVAMENKFNSVEESENIGFKDVEGLTSDEKIIGSGKVKINIINAT